MNVHDWLTNTPASELMVRDVKTLRPTDTLARAAGLLLAEQLSGAPVLDDEGVCVGVLSASDILGAEERVAEEVKREAESSLWHSQLALPVSVYESRLAAIRDKVAPAAQQPVERFMTSDVVTVDANTPAVRVLEDMVNAHIHRVVVTGAGGYLQGVISTIDVLAALLRA